MVAQYGNWFNRICNENFKMKVGSQEYLKWRAHLTIEGL